MAAITDTQRAEQLSAGPRSRRRIAIVALGLLGYFATARLSYALHIQPAMVAIWLPAGLLLAALLLLPRRDWLPTIAGAFVGNALADATHGATVGLALAGSAANCAESVLAAWFLLRLGGSPFTLGSLRQVLALVLGAIVATNALTALPGALVLTHGSLAGFGRQWFLWWTGDGIGMLTTAPAVLTVAELVRTRARIGARTIVEFALGLVAVILITELLLSNRLGPSGYIVASPYMVFPLLMWLAVRFGPWGAASATFALYCVVAWNASHDAGTFAGPGGSPVQQLLNLYAYLAVASVSALIPAAIVNERAVAVTALRRSEERLAQSQKLDAIGSLAGGVAHDFNNLLTVILNYSELLLGEFPEGDPHRDDVAAIHGAGQSAAVLTRQLLIFSRKEVLQPRRLHLNDLVASTGKMMTRLIGEHIVLVMALDADPDAIHADAGQIEQVIVNLVVNARDAMPQGGELLIETRNLTIREGAAASELAREPGEYVILSVRDTGTGMSPETQRRMFEPFYSTKGHGRGTGLGLSTVYGIVQESGGVIEVESELGKGTRIAIWLPRSLEPDSGPGRVRASTPPGGSERILVVEDQRGVREIVGSVLERLGYRVHTEPDGASALEFLASDAEPVDLLLTDVVMPGMSGRELATTFASERPGAKILLMSGYTDDPMIHDGVREREIQFLEKPFTSTALAEKVRKVLDG